MSIVSKIKSLIESLTGNVYLDRDIRREALKLYEEVYNSLRNINDWSYIYRPTGDYPFKGIAKSFDTEWEKNGLFVAFVSFDSGSEQTLGAYSPKKNTILLNVTEAVDEDLVIHSADDLLLPSLAMYDKLKSVFLHEYAHYHHSRMDVYFAKDYISPDKDVEGYLNSQTEFNSRIQELLFRLDKYIDSLSIETALRLLKNSAKFFDILDRLGIIEDLFSNLTLERRNQTNTIINRWRASKTKEIKDKVKNIFWFYKRDLSSFINQRRQQISSFIINDIKDYSSNPLRSLILFFMKLGNMKYNTYLSDTLDSEDIMYNNDFVEYFYNTILKEFGEDLEAGGKLEAFKDSIDSYAEYS